MTARAIGKHPELSIWSRDEGGIEFPKGEVISAPLWHLEQREAMFAEAARRKQGLVISAMMLGRRETYNGYTDIPGLLDRRLLS
jgi:hypothetical protein